MNKEDNTYKPVGDIVLIQVDKPKTETDSGILIKEDWKTLPPTGVILAIGRDAAASSAMEGIRVGMQVVFERYSSIILDDDLRLCRVSNILAIKL